MSTEAPVIEPPPVATEPKPVASEALLSSIRVIRPESQPIPPAEIKEEPPKEPVAEGTKESTPAKEAPVEPKPEPVKPDPTAGMSEKAAARFKNLEKHKTEAEQERDRVKKELEAQKAEFEVLRKEATELETIRKDAQKAIEEAKTYREQLRAASIERDPEFQKQYNGQILARQTQMMELVVSNGADQNEFVRAINSGDEEALETLRESLPAGKQRLWDAHRVDIDKLSYERKEAVKNSDKTWAQMQEDQKRKAASEVERIRIENVETARATVDTIWKEIPDLDKAGAEVREEIESWLTDVVVSAPREQLVKSLAVGQIAQKVVAAQKGEIDRLAETISERDKKIEELEEKLGEQETFIKEASRQSPRPSINGKSSPSTENGSLLSQVKVRLPGQ
jgi:hypothetical protein